MAVAGVRVKLNSLGMIELLRSDGVQNAVERQADGVAIRARSRGIMVEGIPGDVALPISVVRARSTRARALVSIDHPSGLNVESKHRLLVGSLG